MNKTVFWEVWAHPNPSSYEHVIIARFDQADYARRFVDDVLEDHGQTTTRYEIHEVHRVYL